jgi:SulP family sulfate permease
VALTVVLFIRDQIRSSVVRRKMTGAQMFSTQWRLPSEQKTLSEYGSLTTICQLQGTLFFGTTDQLSNELKSDLDHCQYLILDMRRIVSVDYTAAHLLRQFEALLARRGGYLIFCHLSLNLPGGLDLQTYFAQVGLTSGKQNARKFETLDDALRWAEDRILDEHGSRRGGHERVLRLNETELFKDFKDPEALAAFAKIVEEQSFAAGESIFKCGDAGDHLYVIRRGIVRITLSLEGGKYHNLASFSRGDFFGELAFLDCGVRSANAIATEAVDLFVISRARFDQVVNSHPLIASKILTPLARVLASRLRRANAEVMVLHES